MIMASQISTIINEVLDGVERSRLGNIVGPKNEKGEMVINHLPYQTYLKVLDSVLPRNVGMLLKEDTQ